MSNTGVSAFDSTIQTTNIWLNQILDELGEPNRQAGYKYMRAVLHALRDRLSVEQAAALGTQLPLLVRGIYFEGWQPKNKPLKIRHAYEFLNVVADQLDQDDVKAEAVTRAVLNVLSKHVSKGEVNHLKHILPAEIRNLFADEFHTLWY
jgi:uncharacterized protein (DUF2267 family)